MVHRDIYNHAKVIIFIVTVCFIPLKQLKYVKVTVMFQIATKLSPASQASREVENFTERKNT